MKRKLKLFRCDFPISGPRGHRCIMLAYSLIDAKKMAKNLFDQINYKVEEIPMDRPTYVEAVVMYSAKICRGYWTATKKEMDEINN